MIFKEWYTKERFKGPTFQSSSRVLFLSLSPAWRVPLSSLVCVFHVSFFRFLSAEPSHRTLSTDRRGWKLRLRVISLEYYSAWAKNEREPVLYTVPPKKLPRSPLLCALLFHLNYVLQQVQSFWMIVDQLRDDLSLEEFLRFESRFQNIAQIEFCNKKEKKSRCERRKGRNQWKPLMRCIISTWKIVSLAGRWSVCIALRDCVLDGHGYVGTLAEISNRSSV